MTGLILQIQTDALDPSTSVSTLLRKVKVAAVKLNIAAELPWVDRELSGYNGITEAELPSYRHLTGALKVRNPFHGLQPLNFADPRQARECSRAPIGQALPELETILATKDEGLQFTIPPGLAKRLMDSMEIPLEPVLLLSRASVAGIVDAVRNLVIEWSLEMEKAGVLGEGMTFSQRERDIAVPATQQFVIQNVGVLGDVSGNAQVSNKQTAHSGIDLAAITTLLEQIGASRAALPSPLANTLDPIISELRAEASESNPDPSRLRKLLTSARAICEGAAGNLLASGIAAQIGTILGS